MEREELKQSILKDLNSEEYPFIVEVRGNKVIARWKFQEIPEGADEESLRKFSVWYKLRKDGTFYGGEMEVRHDAYTPPTSTTTTHVFSIRSSEDLPWRKKVDKKDWANIGYDPQKLYSIVEHYLMGKGYFYRPGVWNHAYLSRSQGFLFRIVGALFVFVGGTLFYGALSTGVLAFILFPWIHIIIGIWLLLIGFGKVEFYDLRPRIGVKVVVGTIIIAWLLVFAFMIFEMGGLR